MEKKMNKQVDVRKDLKRKKAEIRRFRIISRLWMLLILMMILLTVLFDIKEMIVPMLICMGAIILIFILYIITILREKKKLQGIISWCVKEKEFTQINIVDEYYKGEILRALIASGYLTFEQERYGINVIVKKDEFEIGKCISFVRNNKISEVFDIFL